MKKKIFIIIGLLFSTGLFAQGVYNNGARIVIGSGGFIYIGGPGGNYRNETNITNGSIDLSGTLILEGNYTNNVAASDVLSTVGVGSEIIFKGTTPQTIGGTTTTPFTFSKLTINNGTGVTLLKDAIVNGGMTFTSGLFNLGTSNLTFGPVATVAGTPSSTSMIVSTGTGQARKVFSSIGNFTFPVGDNNVTAKYSPVTLNFTAGTFAVGAYAGVNLKNSVFPDPVISGAYLNRYWTVSQSGITSFVCNGMFQYLPADMLGIESHMSCLQLVPPTLYAYWNPADTVLHQLSATGLTSFGNFTGSLTTTKALNLKVYLEGLYAGAGLMNTAMDFNGITFLPKWGAGIADHINIELHSTTSYATTIATFPDLPLATNGTFSATIPATYNGSYYLTLKHRNSVETVSANPVSFSAGTINYDFSTAATQAYGSNLKNIGGVFTVYAGDVTSAGFNYPLAPVQDGSCDLLDLYYIYPSYLAGGLGYLPSDINGDGVVDLTDTYIGYANYLLGIFKMTPP